MSTINRCAMPGACLVLAASILQWACSAPKKIGVDNDFVDTPVIIGDGSLMILLDPFGATTFDNFDPKPPGPGTDIASIATSRDVTVTAVIVGSSQNPPQTYCTDTTKACGVHVYFGTGAKTVDASWPATSGSYTKALALSFPEQPINRFIHWEKGSKVVLHPTAGNITKVEVDGATNPVCTSGCRVIIRMR